MTERLADKDVPQDHQQRIRRLRADLGLTHTRLAAELGVSFATVNRWESGQAKPSQLSWGQLVKLTADRARHTGAGDAEAAARGAAEAPDLLDFTTPAEVVGVLAEGGRLSFGHLANPAFAAETSKIDPLPHQRLAVCEHRIKTGAWRWWASTRVGRAGVAMRNKISPLESNPLFGSLPFELAENIRSGNPWWTGGEPLQPPRFRRWPFERMLRMLRQGMTPATVLRGPRRVGKTILLKQAVQALLADRVAGNRILYVPFDELPTLKGIQEPVLAISRWFEQHMLGQTFNAMANRALPAYLLFDEVQNLDAWAPQVKNLVDNHGVRCLITGSSSLRIEAGRDSLAGRVTTLEMGPLLLREIADLRFDVQCRSPWADNGLERLLDPEFWHEAIRLGREQSDIRRQSFMAYSQRGGYPIAQERHDTPWHELADYLNETVIRRAIQHDLRMGPRGQKRDERLLEEVFRLCCRYAGQTAGQAAFVTEIQQALAGNIGWSRILTYLKFLDGTLLVRLVQPIELRLKRKKAPARLCLSDHTLRASWLQEVIPLDADGLASSPHLADIAGRLAESTLGYFLASIPTLDVAHFPQRGAEPEVDFILTIGTKRIPIEVKYRKRIDPLEDTRGLRAFLEKAVYNAPFGLLVTLEDDVPVSDPRVIPISLSSFLWTR